MLMLSMGFKGFVVFKFLIFLCLFIPLHIIALLDVSFFRSAAIVSTLTTALLGVGVALGGVRYTLLEYLKLI